MTVYTGLKDDSWRRSRQLSSLRQTSDVIATARNEAGSNLSLWQRDCFKGTTTEYFGLLHPCHPFCAVIAKGWNAMEILKQSFEYRRDIHCKLLRQSVKYEI
jgi:hypothetical protein